MTNINATTQSNEPGKFKNLFTQFNKKNNISEIELLNITRSFCKPLKIITSAFRTSRNISNLNTLLDKISITDNDKLNENTSLNLTDQYNIVNALSHDKLGRPIHKKLLILLSKIVHNFSESNQIEVFKQIFNPNLKDKGTNFRRWHKYPSEIALNIFKNIDSYSEDAKKEFFNALSSSMGLTKPSYEKVQSNISFNDENVEEVNKKFYEFCLPFAQQDKIPDFLNDDIKFHINTHLKIDIFNRDNLDKIDDKKALASDIINTIINRIESDNTFIKKNHLLIGDYNNLKDKEIKFLLKNFDKVDNNEKTNVLNLLINNKKYREQIINELLDKSESENISDSFLDVFHNSLNNNSIFYKSGYIKISDILTIFEKYFYKDISSADFLNKTLKEFKKEKNYLKLEILNRITTNYFQDLNDSSQNIIINNYVRKKNGESEFINVINSKKFGNFTNQTARKILNFINYTQKEREKNILESRSSHNIRNDLSLLHSQLSLLLSKKFTNFTLKNDKNDCNLINTTINSLSNSIKSYTDYITHNTNSNDTLFNNYIEHLNIQDYAVIFNKENQNTNLDQQEIIKLQKNLIDLLMALGNNIKSNKDFSYLKNIVLRNMLSQNPQENIKILEKLNTLENQLAKHAKKTPVKKKLYLLLNRDSNLEDIKELFKNNNLWDTPISGKIVLECKFKNEEGLDYGGPSQEFLNICEHQLKNNLKTCLILNRFSEFLPKLKLSQEKYKDLSKNELIHALSHEKTVIDDLVNLLCTPSETPLDKTNPNTKKLEKSLLFETSKHIHLDIKKLLTEFNTTTDETQKTRLLNTIKTSLLNDCWPDFKDSSWDIFPTSSIEFFAQLISLASLSVNSHNKHAKYTLSADLIQPAVVETVFPDEDSKMMSFWSKTKSNKNNDESIGTSDFDYNQKIDTKYKHMLIEELFLCTDEDFDDNDTYITFFNRFKLDYFDFNKDFFKSINHDSLNLETIQSTELPVGDLDINKTVFSIKDRVNTEQNNEMIDLISDLFKTWLEKNKTNTALIEKFYVFFTGGFNTSLTIEINIKDIDEIYSHTCFQSIDVPNNHELYKNQELFNTILTEIVSGDITYNRI